jgi:hypothetical protein
MKNKTLLFLILIPFLAFKCTSTKNATKEKTDFPFEIIFNENVNINDNFSATVRNISNKDVKILHPHLKYIEVKEENSWRRIRIVLCPCDANCDAPPKEKILKTNEIHKIKWDLVESWCEVNKGTNIKELHKTLPTLGEYRFSVRFIINETEEKTITKEFKLNKS